MRGCCGNKSGAPYDLVLVDRQDISGVLIVELIAFAPVRARKLLPFSLDHVDFVTQSKVRQQFCIVEMPIGICDNVNRAFTPDISSVEQSAFMWIG